MANPNKPKMHILKGRTGDSQAVAMCGKRVSGHLIINKAQATCVNCLKRS